MFLTLEDPRAKVQGSRDPLGVQPVWAAFGRHVVTNLTTVSNSVRGFTILLLGRYYAQRLIEERRAGEKDVLSIFLRMEQLGAYARYVGHDVEGDIRGIERVKWFRAEHGAKVPIQDNATGMILSDQKTYGLWGLFSVSSRVSGLIADGPIGVSQYAREFVETRYAPRLRRVEDEFFRLLLRGGVLDTGGRNPLFRALVDVLPEKFDRDETSFYGETLRDGQRVSDSVAGRQRLAAALLEKHTDLEATTERADVEALARAAEEEDPGLAVRFRKIARIEALLAPADAIFSHLQARNGQTPGTIAQKLLDHWGKDIPHLDAGQFEDLLPEIVDIVGADLAALMHRCDSALAAGDYREAISALIDWNALVMQRRQGAPWIRVQGGKLDVRYRSNEQDLPDGDELPALWRNSYFLDSLKTISRQLESVA